MENKLKILQNELSILIGNSSNGVIITNYRSKQQKEYFTVHLTKNILRLVETFQRTNKQDWLYNFDKNTLLRNGHNTTQYMLSNLGDKFTSIANEITSENITVFEDTSSATVQETEAALKDMISNPNYTSNIEMEQLSEKELSDIVGKLAVNTKTMLDPSLLVYKALHSKNKDMKQEFKSQSEEIRNQTKQDLGISSKFKIARTIIKSKSGNLLKNLAITFKSSDHQKNLDSQQIQMLKIEDTKQDS